MLNPKVIAPLNKLTVVQNRAVVQNFRRPLKKYVNPNPHRFKAITKLTASGRKEPLLYPTSRTALWGSGGGWEGLLCSPEELLLIKT
jgi:hypothetical protein